MPKLTAKPPKLRRHASGQGVVTFANKDWYMGRWPNKSRPPKHVVENYQRFLGEHFHSEMYLPDAGQNEVSVTEAIAAYWSFAKRRYTKNGQPTSEVGLVKSALRSLRELYGSTQAAEFGPLKLQALRDHIARNEDLTRGVLNRKIGRIKRCFRWLKNNEVIPSNVYDSIRDVEGLRRGEGGLREPQAIQPVPDEVVQQTLPYLPEVVADMVQLQRRTGMRPGEVVIVRPCDVEKTGGVWYYRPHYHKTEHRGKSRIICIGPKGQDVLRKYLLRPDEAYCFSPAEQQKKRFAEMREHVKDPSRDRRNRRSHTGLNPHYSPNSYRVAIYRAVDKANAERKDSEKLPRWTPNQLRHTAATEVRNLYGVECAQAVLGHSHVDVTEMYAQVNLGKAQAAMKEIG